jgi:hypothetical protein
VQSLFFWEKEKAIQLNAIRLFANNFLARVRSFLTAAASAITWGFLFGSHSDIPSTQGILPALLALVNVNRDFPSSFFDCLSDSLIAIAIPPFV